ncbi:LuxR C-terminal-related transcriptional regulator [Rhizobium sp. 16-449-1b]|uniref:helix-turn-helix transcriptional regulator n=1 Tax=Rhizobium sp. 16-449-1b TaxID=2819989 RepID=UPI001FFE08CF|nr:LuxR C-terminal-related transcriptional regulator [Rhizobium sp. 16-449-1b]
MEPDLLQAIVRLLRADFAASYKWSDKTSRYEKSISFNMDASNMERYETYFQFRDPMTEHLRKRRAATLVDEVISRDELLKTEFYNDFLRVDGLDRGVNMFVFDGMRHLRDLRIWRAPDRPEFGEREVGLLNALEPFLKRSFVRSFKGYENLTQREADVIALIARGCTDRDIARLLGISFSTVRTHINKAMEKNGCSNRAELAMLVVHGRLDS